MKVYQVVEVEWDDAVLRSGSADASTIKGEGMMRRRSVGYRLPGPKGTLVLGMTDDLDGRFDDRLTVPLAWVRKIRYLRKGRKK